jgi:hypothetical protein
MRTHYVLYKLRLHVGVNVISWILERVTFAITKYSSNTVARLNAIVYEFPDPVIIIVLSPNH